MYLNADVHACVQVYRQRVTGESRKKQTNKEDMNKVVYEKAGVDYAQTSALFPFFFSPFFPLFYLFIISMHILFSIVLTSTSTAEKFIALHISLNSMAIVDM